MPKVTNISAMQAMELTSLPNNTVLISINPSNGDLFNLKLDRNSSKILTVCFDDVTAPKEYQGVITAKPIDYETTLKILDFININKGKDFLIQCAAGISRSSAVALYLHIMYNYELRNDFWMRCRPNSYVLGKLFLHKFQHRYIKKDILTLKERNKEVIGVNNNVNEKRPIVPCGSKG